VPSERIVQKTLEEVFERATGRIIVASFASHIHRVSQVVEAAKKHNRLIGVAGTLDGPQRPDSPRARLPRPARGR
jgi:mRNA degradation ribonuclease J1/J2